MSIRYYDAAVTKKIKDWVIDENMKVFSPDNTEQLFSNLTDQNKDKPLKLPIITISRGQSIDLLSPNKKSLSYDGRHIMLSNGTSAVLNAIPISLSYQLDVYTKYFSEADEYMRNFIFNLINYPDVETIIPYNGSDFTSISTIHVQSPLSDSSSVPQRIVQGRFTRMTIKFTVDDAYYFSIPFMKNWNILDDGKIIVKDDE